MKFAFIIIYAAFLSCTSELPLEVSQKDKVIVMNGVLVAESILKVKLSYSQRLNDISTTIPIEDAEVHIKENLTRIIKLHHVGNGEYISNSKAQRRHFYQVSAHIQGRPILEAEDSVPDTPTINACFSHASDRTGGYDVDVNLQISNEVPGKDNIWIDVLTKDYKESTSPELITTKAFYIFSNSSGLDNFNSTYDNASREFEYILFVRQSDESRKLPEPKIKITGADGHRFFRYNTLTSLDENQKLLINVYNCSRAYDRYLKSSLLEYVIEDLYSVPDPMNGPTKIYSNVKNGEGIFGAFTMKTIEVNSISCK